MAHNWRVARPCDPFGEGKISMGKKKAMGLFGLLLVLVLSLFAPSGASARNMTPALKPASAPSVPPPSKDASLSVMRKGPYLVYSGRSTAMTLMWQTYETPRKATVEWGPTPSYGHQPVTVVEYGMGIDGHLFSYTISNLDSGTRVYWRVTVDEKRFTGSFLAPPAVSAVETVFYAYGESFSGRDVRNRLMERLITDKKGDPDHRQTMILHSGDYVFRGLIEHWWDLDLFDRSLASAAESLQDFPLIGALGSHEGFLTAPGEGRIMLQNIGQFFRKYFPYPMYRQANHSYYSFDYGPAHVMVLDTWSYAPGQDGGRLPDSTQINWLQQDLKATRKPWKIVLLNTPVWDCKFDSGDLRKLLAPIIESSGIQLVLQGRAHYYSHVKRGNVTYLTLGGGGAPLAEPTPFSAEAKPFLIRAEKAHHFARFDIKGNTMIVTIVKDDGAVIETFPVDRFPPAPK